MNDRLAASWVLMAGAALLGYWFYHLSGPDRAALLAKGRTAGAEGLQPASVFGVGPAPPMDKHTQGVIDSADPATKRLRDQLSPRSGLPGFTPPFV